ncbi:MAG: hypothetical protein HOP10_06710 [Chitinophagaceae bacterium]|nr:hypothetical protein [Chitinophagaceae bacterium]
MKFTFLILVTALLLVSSSASSQLYKIRGTVYDSSRNFPMEAVSVLTTSGRGAITNSDGRYEIDVVEKDSIWFSYLNKPTMKFPVLKIANPFEFDISLQVNVPMLKEVKVRPKNYKLDSIQNRIDYAKIFNSEKPKLKPVTPQYGAAMGFDLNEIINMFRFRRNRSIAAFKERLLQEERDKSVDHRFNKALVRRLTLLDSSRLDSFMRVFRPSYFFTQVTSDYEFQEYIKIALYRFKKGLPPDPMMKQEPDEE